MPTRTSPSSRGTPIPPNPDDPRPPRRGTLISWADETWNPVTGCTAASAGCDHCYARTLINKWFGANVKAAIAAGFTKPHDGMTVVELARAAGVVMPYTAMQAARPFSSVQCWPTRLGEPAKWKTGRRVFVNSLSDVFHPGVPEEFKDAMYAVMEQQAQHVYQLLTKRPDDMARYTVERYARSGIFDGLERAEARTRARVPEQLWHGTSIEDARVLWRLEALGEVPAPVKFISAEPLIGPLVTEGVAAFAAQLVAAGIRQVIVGGESGPGYRPMAMSWCRDIRDACVAAGVAFFFKQDAAFRTETRCYLVEEDGSRWEWHQWPDDMAAPRQVEGFTHEVALRA